MFNRTSLLILVAAAAAGLGLWFAQKQFAGPVGPQLQRVTLLPEAREVADFELRRAEGGSLTPRDLHGRWSIVFFGFTHCPDICPTTLAELAQAQTLWEQALPEHERPHVVFVSADPERDSPELTQEYASFFSPAIIGATAEVAALERFGRSLLLVFAKVPLEGGDYTIDHSAQLSIMSPEGRFVAFARPSHGGEPGPAFPPRQIADDMITLVEASR